MMINVAALLVVASIACADVTGAAERQRNEVIHIDGKKNPELIPQWSAWEDALRIVAGGSKQLPSMVLDHVTKEEAALILREAEGQLRRDETCKKQVLDLYGLNGKPQVVTEKVQSLKLDCRWQTLHARDRIMASLTPAAQVALVAFIDSVKASTTVTLSKRDLPFFLQPQ